MPNFGLGFLRISMIPLTLAIALWICCFISSSKTSGWRIC